MAGGLLWYIAGFVTCLALMNDWLQRIFVFAASVVGGLVTFALELPFNIGIAGVLVLIGFALWFGGRWAERARGRYDANNAWKNRSRYRQG